MNKTICMVMAMCVAGAAAAADLATLTYSFSTPGPDAYADGTPVQVGETYLLVYSANGAFAGIRTDGSLVDPVADKVVCSAQAVEGSRCAFTAIQYPAGEYPQGGAWFLVLLDTRDADGKIGSLVAAQGAVKQAVGGEKTLSGLALGEGAGGSGLRADVSSSALANVPQPVLTGVTPQNGKADVRFGNFAEGQLYKVETTTDLGAGWQVAKDRVAGKQAKAVLGAGGNPEIPVEVTVPANDRVRFFRVVVP